MGDEDTLLYEMRLVRDDLKKLTQQVIRIEERMVHKDEYRESMEGIPDKKSVSDIEAELNKVKKVAWSALACAVIIGERHDIMKLISLLF